MRLVKRILEGRHFSLVGLGGCALSISVILLLKHTLKNIMCVLKPFERGHKPPIESVLEGRHFFAVGF